MRIFFFFFSFFHSVLTKSTIITANKKQKQKARIRSGVGMAWAAMVSLIKQENRQEDSTRLLDYLFKDQVIIVLFFLSFLFFLTNIFFFSQTLADIDFEVRKEMLNAGIRLIR